MNIIGIELIRNNIIGKSGINSSPITFSDLSVRIYDSIIDRKARKVVFNVYTF